MAGMLGLDTCSAAQASTGNSYTSNFPLTENPISEKGTWVNGKAVGLDWSNVETSPGLAVGTQDGNGNSDDSTAVLPGNWAADQTAQATVRLKARAAAQQVELRLRTTITAHSITGYAINFSVGSTNSVQIVCWNGSFNNFTFVASTGNYTISDGDVVKASISGNTIIAYKNGEQILQANDSTFSSGSPGMAFFIGPGGANANFGFSSFAATGSTSVSTSSTSNNGTYTTSFSLTENPISEGGKWAGGQSAGGNLWGDVQTNGGVAFGVSQPTGFGDPTAILTGTWAADQTAQATVWTDGSTTGVAEVELRLRNTISSGSITGYEAYCSTLSGNRYCNVARWNGPNGSYCNLVPGNTNYLSNGDQIKATVTGTNPVTITLYRLQGGSWNQLLTVDDTGQSTGDCPGGAHAPFASGAPGIGFYTSGNFTHNGFTSFTATGGSGATAPAPPTNLTATVAP